MGETDLENMKDQIKNFPWQQELSNPKVKSSPTISIKDNLNQYVFAITLYGDPKSVVNAVLRIQKECGSQSNLSRRLHLGCNDGSSGLLF